MPYLSLLVFSLFLLTACEGNDHVTVTKPAEATKTPAQTGNFADPQIQAYKKAQEVQHTVDAANEKRRQQMEEEGM